MSEDLGQQHGGIKSAMKLANVSRGTLEDLLVDLNRIQVMYRIVQIYSDGRQHHAVLNVPINFKIVKKER